VEKRQHLGSRGRNKINIKELLLTSARRGSLKIGIIKFFLIFLR